jgi:hypothetical protein
MSARLDILRRRAVFVAAAAGATVACSTTDRSAQPCLLVCDPNAGRGIEIGFASDSPGSGLFVNTLCVGDTARLAAYRVAACQTGRTRVDAQWSSDAPAVLAIDNDGRLLALATGAAEIIATTAEGGAKRTFVAADCTDANDVDSGTADATDAD